MPQIPVLASVIVAILLSATIIAEPATAQVAHECTKSELLQQFQSTQGDWFGRQGNGIVRWGSFRRQLSGEGPFPVYQLGRFVANIESGTSPRRISWANGRMNVPRLYPGQIAAVCIVQPGEPDHPRGPLNYGNAADHELPTEVWLSRNENQPLRVTTPLRLDARLLVGVMGSDAPPVVDFAVASIYDPESKSVSIVARNDGNSSLQWEIEIPGETIGRNRRGLPAQTTIEPMVFTAGDDVEPISAMCHVRNSDQQLVASFGLTVLWKRR